MNLSYAARPEPVHQPHATPASAYTTERRLLARYRELLYAPSQDVEVLMVDVWGPLTEGQMYGTRTGNDGKIDRLDHLLPELLQLLRWDEQAPLVGLLEAGDLVGGIRELLRRERTLHQREPGTRRLANDESHAKAAGLGRLSREAYGRAQPLGEPLVLTPPPIDVPTPRKAGPLRASHRRTHRVGLGQQLAFWPVGA